jgi:phosphate transport system substrate-binding protein
MKRVYTTALLALVLTVITSSCGEQATKQSKTGGELKGTISISGAFALYPMTVKWAEEFQKLHPKVRIDVSAGGAGKGMTDALSEMIDLGMFSRGISKEEVAKGAWYIAVAKDAVVPTINSANPNLAAIKARGMTNEEFVSLFLTQTTRSWNQLVKSASANKINVYIRSDACGAAEMWGIYLGKNQESLNGIGVFGDPGIADAVKNDKFGIGFNNIIYAYDISSRKVYPGMEVIPLDLNGNGKIDKEENFYNSLDEIMNAIRKGNFPSPPARDLYFVSKGKPKNQAAVEFLKWILDEGQKYVNEAGYVALTPEKLQSELSKLNP